jgi:hypothetical protein
VSIAASETRTLDVVMAVQDLAPKDDGGMAQPSAEREKN